MVYKFGVGCVSENYNYAFRCRYHQESKDKGNMLLHAKGSNRGTWKHGGWRLNFYSVYSPAVSKLIKNGMLLGIRNRHSKDYFNVRVESGSKNHKGLELKDLCSLLKFRWLRTIDSKLKVGVEVKMLLDRQLWIGGTGRTCGKIPR